MEKIACETEEVIFELRDGILYGIYKRGLKITLDKAKKIVADRIKFCNGRNYPAIAFDNGMVSLDRRARQFFASDEGNKCVSAVAFVSDSVFNMYLVRFYLKISLSKPKIPIKIFTDKKKALKWLEQYKS